MLNIRSIAYVVFLRVSGKEFVCHSVHIRELSSMKNNLLMLGHLKISVKIDAMWMDRYLVCLTWFPTGVMKALEDFSHGYFRLKTVLPS